MITRPQHRSAALQRPLWCELLLTGDQLLSGGTSNLEVPSSASPAGRADAAGTIVDQRQDAAGVRSDRLPQFRTSLDQNDFDLHTCVVMPVHRNAPQTSISCASGVASGGGCAILSFLRFPRSPLDLHTPTRSIPLAQLHSSFLTNHSHRLTAR